MPAGNNTLDELIEPTALCGFGKDTSYSSGNVLSPEVYNYYYQLLQEPDFNALLFYDEIAVVNRLLQKLPPNEARICALYFIDDYSYLEIARFTNLSPTTVKNHIAWSMIILRNYMTKPKAPV